MRTGQNSQFLVLDVIIQADGARLVRIALGVFVRRYLLQARIRQAMPSRSAPIFDTPNNLHELNRTIMDLYILICPQLNVDSNDITIQDTSRDSKHYYRLCIVE